MRLGFLPFRVEIKTVFQNVSFKCQRCGSCCHHRRPKVFGDLVSQDRLEDFWTKSNLIYLTKKDIQRISQRTRLDSANFVDTLYEDKTGSVRVEDSGKKVILDLPIMKTKKDGTCVFYEEGKCKIYPFRPAACRLFPFVVVEESTPEGNILLKISYNPTCPGIGKGKEVDRKKLEKLVTDQFVQRMKIIGPQIQKLRRAGKVQPGAEICRTMPGRKDSR
ncbi:MAG: YkgJ family cysteine cluster protein [Methanotrichaceae archaeon]